MSVISVVAGIIDTSNLPKPAADNNTVSTIMAIVFSVTASIAVLIIVIAGFRYIVAHGDPSATAQARNTITYAVVGLLIVIAAYSIVTFVIGSIN